MTRVIEFGKRPTNSIHVMPRTVAGCSRFTFVLAAFINKIACDTACVEELVYLSQVQVVVDTEGDQMWQTFTCKVLFRDAKLFVCKSALVDS